ncbi:hypothetical protein C8A01DRAFT_49642 [Parachaetomium inaequale]|uniref:Uncharacterized protein n=1 Tax=Parachaetomium inaequale TaxID=2588326 RepID=A0AAN6P8W0_9PEZI|nr:hypothetical protein C8A01DRAFT_49642 [Parachaetomium inaequale]
MSGAGLEVLLEDLIPEIAYSGEKGVSITELLKIVRRYHLSLDGQDASNQDDAARGVQAPVDDADLEKSLTDAEMASARWAWDWLRSRPQILINGNKRWNRLELSEALALPEAESIDPAIAAASEVTREPDQAKGKKSKTKKALTTRPRIHPAEDLVWQTLTRHGVDYKRVPALEWACLQGVASTRAEGILQSDLRRLVDQDKRSLPKRTDSLARKGYIAKRTVVVQKMKTSRLWLIDFAPPLVEAETCGLDLTPETLSKDLEPVPWHQRWTGNNIDMDALGRTAVGVVKAFNVIRYADLRLKMGVSGKRWQMKTLAKNCQRLVDVGVLKYTAASFPGTRKVFKDCLKFVREPSAEEWDKFLATGKKTSLYSDPTRHREPKPNALALYGKSGGDGEGSGDDRSKVKRIFSGWIPEKPLAQTVFEVIRSAGSEGASNPQVSVATVGYQHRRYLSSYLTKVAETQQPLHLKKFQVVSKLVRTGKTSAYMFSAPGAAGQPALPRIDKEEEPTKEQARAEGSSDSAPTGPYDFGVVRAKAFSTGQDFSLSDMSRIARKSKPSNKRKLLPRIRPEHLVATAAAHQPAAENAVATADQEGQPAELGGNGSLKRSFDEMSAGPSGAQDGVVEPSNAPEQDPPSTSTAVSAVNKLRTDEELVLNVQFNGVVGKLRVHRSDRTLTFLRSGRGLKKPVTIPVDENLAEPAIQDVPESGEKSLVFTTGQKDGAPTRIHVFIFDNEGQDNAVWIRQEVIKMRSPDYQEPTPEELAAASKEITVEAAPAGPARGKGRGGGRGKGKKGQALPAGAKPYVCELCGGSWKNDIGLKYHLQKAQVPCNPNFDPNILLERSRKRRRLSPVPPSEANSEAGDGEGLYKPFAPSSEYDRLSTEAKRRINQAYDVIKHLLDNNLGVFPGDKALFYALTKVFLKEFSRQMPPTWKNFTSAVKVLESRQEAAVHTHMLKTGRGRLQTCTLLIRTGVDPNGIIANKMKQKMRETYPATFIPPAFSPTQQELALLQELDRKTTDKNNGKPNANGQKFRSRRKIEEIEVFDAPYYKNTAPVVGPRRDPLWIRDTERLTNDSFVGRKRYADDDGLAGPSQKRARAGFETDEYGDIPVDPSILGDASQYGQLEGPSVLEAIKTYSLLPAKLGPRGGRRRPSLAKLSPELGIIRNPGLGSLPGEFFGEARAPASIQFVSPEVLILEPNTELEEEVETDEEGQEQGQQGQGQAVSRESTEDIQDEVGAEEAEEAAEETIEEPKTFRFAWPAVLEPGSEGLWPDPTDSFWERNDGSFTLRGWMPRLTWLQSQNLPFSAKEMAQKQKAEKIKLRDWVDRSYARFCSLVNQCAAWEQSRLGTAVMLGSNVAPGYSFINVSPPVSRANSRPVTLGWSEDTEYGLETLPYEELEDDDYGDVIYIEDPSARDGEPSPKKRRVQKAGGGVKRMQGRPPKLKLAAIKTLREHTAFPKSADDFLQDEREDLDWSSENVRLAAFIVVTTLLGGVDRVVDWGLMLRLVPDQTISQLRHYWCALKKDRLSTIVSLTEKFRRAFLRAYENDEIPPLDFDNVLAYDWKFLIKWTTKLDMAERRMLPSTRKALDKTVTVTKFKHGNRPWREAFYHPQRSIFNKFQDVTSEALALSVDNIPDPKPSTDMIVAMSWTRSLCVTPVEAYTADAVIHRRNSLFLHRSKTEITELMVKGVDQLQRQGVISKSSSKWSNGRRWRFNTRVLDSIEKAAQQEKFAKAVQFKKELDQAFRVGEEKKRVTYITNDGMIMALLNLQANGRVRIETTGQPNVPMGHEPGNYETRKYTKKYMHFRLDIFPTESYLYDDVDPEEEEDTALSDLRTRIRTTPPPTRGPGGAVPVWCDVFNKPDPVRWLKYLSAVLITLASRGSMRAEELVKTLKPVIMVFEAELIIEWAAGLGLLKAQLGGMAPAVMEWWWIAVEVQRDGLMEGGAAGKGAGMGVPGEGGAVGVGGSALRQRKALPSGRPVRAGET